MSEAIRESANQSKQILHFQLSALKSDQEKPLTQSMQHALMQGQSFLFRDLIGTLK